MHLKIFPCFHWTILGPIKLCIVFKSLQFGELPTEVVTKISLLSICELDQQLLNNTRILVGPAVACHLGNNITKSCKEL